MKSRLKQNKSFCKTFSRSFFIKLSLLPLLVCLNNMQDLITITGINSRMVEWSFSLVLQDVYNSSLFFSLTNWTLTYTLLQYSEWLLFQPMEMNLLEFPLRTSLRFSGTYISYKNIFYSIFEDMSQWGKHWKIHTYHRNFIYRPNRVNLEKLFKIVTIRPISGLADH